MQADLRVSGWHENLASDVPVKLGKAWVTKHFTHIGMLRVALFAALCVAAVCAIPNWEERVAQLESSNAALFERVQALEEKMMNSKCKLFVDVGTGVGSGDTLKRFLLKNANVSVTVDARRSRRSVTTGYTTTQACTCVGRPGAPGIILTSRLLISTSLSYFN